MGGAAPGVEGRNLDHLCLSVVPFERDAILAHLQAHGVRSRRIRFALWRGRRGPLAIPVRSRGQRGRVEGATCGSRRRSNASPGSIRHEQPRFHPPPDLAARRPVDARSVLHRHHLPRVPADGCATRCRAAGDPADHQRLPDRLCGDEHRAWAAVRCDRPAFGDRRRHGGFHPGLGRLRVGEGPADAACVPRGPGPVRRRRADRRARGDPRPVPWRRCAAADEPGLDAVRHRPGDRADRRRLDPGLGTVAGDLLVPDRILGGAAAGHLVVVPGNQSASRAHAAGRAQPGCATTWRSSSIRASSGWRRRARSISPACSCTSPRRRCS